MVRDDTGPRDQPARGPVRPETVPSGPGAPNRTAEPIDTPPERPAPTDPPTVRAAGAVVWRDGSDGEPEVAVVHRPRYGDWSLPKGKLDPGETIAHAAAREVTEETGVTCVLSRHLRRVHYRVPGRNGAQADKQVDYFAARARGGTFAPNSEVDELRWLSVGRAREQLSYPHDARVLDAFELHPADVVTLLLVRHAKAGSRAEFSGDDTLRPLSEAGMRQRRALHTFLPLFGPERVYSAPRVRCEQTVEPVADDLGTGIVREPRLAEESYRDDPASTQQRLLQIAAGTGTALVCSQGGVIPGLVTGLAASAGLELGEVDSKKASVWTLTFRSEPSVGPGPGRPAPGPPLRLAAADYHPEPVRTP